ncbi:hypothetical protein [Mesobacillus zeae]|uniref:Uncharacterized protein n=1 Tax=Mesobacillus zeae TaxID=1917180 RepID=A0A398BG05_9BACI|nr:hypothetical protein [Mesobacillus zeae]RID88992.1 hypothetical protein D1970_00380 [Mesobacillus zeae]
MNELERYKLVKFCVMATSVIRRIDIDNVDEKRFLNMSSEELTKESDRLEYLLKNDAQFE